MENKRLQFITRTAVLLSLTLVFQILGRYLTPFMGTNGNFVVGPLVNACLLVSTSLVGIWSGMFISVAAPVGAMLTGGLPHIYLMPIVAAGNLILVVCFYFIKKAPYVGIVIGALLKFIFLFAAVSNVLKIIGLPEKVSKILYFTFGWPQLVTALAGGVLAMGVLKVIQPKIIR